jgi:hypothetical protein
VEPGLPPDAPWEATIEKALAAAKLVIVAFSRRPSVKAPIAVLWLASSIIITITGTATTPLTPALQKGAFNVSIGVKLMITPTTIAAAITA